VIDAPILRSSVDSPYRIVGFHPGRLDPRCASRVIYGKPYYGEQGDRFIVSLRIVHEMENSDGSLVSRTQRTGFDELANALWMCQSTKVCSHSTSSGEGTIIPPRCALISGFPGDMRGDFKVNICQTEGNKVARWMALISTAHVTDMHNVRGYPILLKGQGTCLTCAVDEALAWDIEQCFLIL
jgi:hypothetical protein